MLFQWFQRMFKRKNETYSPSPIGERKHPIPIQLIIGQWHPNLTLYETLRPHQPAKTFVEDDTIET